jgi:hypothetical protein
MLGCAPQTLPSVASVATPQVRTCSLRSLQEELEVTPAIEAYAVAQILAIAEVYVYRTQAVDWVCLVHQAIAEACASGNLEIGDSVPTAVAGEMHTVPEHAAVEAYCFANCSEGLRTFVPYVDRDVVSVQRGMVEAGKSPYLSPAAVDQGTCFVASLDDTEHRLW